MFGKNKTGRVPSAKRDFTKLKTPHTYVIIFFVVIACWILTFSSDRFTISSDGQGSMPVFNEKGEFQGIGIGKASCLLKEVRECVQREEILLEIAVKGITSNPASILKLDRKGHIKEGFDADICLLEEGTLELNTVIAKGQIMVRDRVQKVFGTFERS